MLWYCSIFNIIYHNDRAIQVIPELQKVASHIYSYQRTVAWVSPRDQFTYPRIIKLVFRWFPVLLKLYRFMLFVQVNLCIYIVKAKHKATIVNNIYIHNLLIQIYVYM